MHIHSYIHTFILSLPQVLQAIEERRLANEALSLVDQLKAEIEDIRGEVPAYAEKLEQAMMVGRLYNTVQCKKGQLSQFTLDRILITFQPNHALSSILD